MLTRNCPAKINLFLEVVEKRPDGYHNIDSVFSEIRLYDTLSVEAHDGRTIELDCSDPTLPCDERNLAVKAVLALQAECGVKTGLRLRLRKRIPSGAGLGGGSSDAAGALLLANEAWKLGFPAARLHAIAVRIGADVPFFLSGGICRCRGIGEDVTPLEGGAGAAFRIGLAMPPIHSNTAEAYRRLRLPKPGEARTAAAMIDALAGGRHEDIEAAAFNRFEDSVYDAIPELGRIQRELETLVNRPVRLSGSGSGLWFVLRDGERLADAAMAWAASHGILLEVLPVNPNRKAGHFA